MTLCIVWRKDNCIHFASDSRLTFGNSHADVGIKILSVPYIIYAPLDNVYRTPNILAEGSLGLCIAGSPLNAMIIKESIVEVVKHLQAVPGIADFSMEGISNFIFEAYKIISTKLCQTDLYKSGRTTMAVSGWCTTNNTPRSFMFETDDNNQYSKKEILTHDSEQELIGSGAESARKILSLKTSVTNKEYVQTLKSVIDDDSVLTVGGAVQYGCLEENNFKILGVIDYDEESQNGVSYMRGGLNLRQDEFDKLLPLMRYIDLENS